MLSSCELLSRIFELLLRVIIENVRAVIASYYRECSSFYHELLLRIFELLLLVIIENVRAVITSYYRECSSFPLFVFLVLDCLSINYWVWFPIVLENMVRVSRLLYVYNMFIWWSKQNSLTKRTFFVPLSRCSRDDDFWFTVWCQTYHSLST